MDAEVARAINNLSKKVNEISYRLDEFFNMRCDNNEEKIDKVSANTGNLWDSETTYEVDEYCTYDGLLYRCIVKNRGQLPTNKDFFVKATIGEVLNTQGQDPQEAYYVK